MWPFQPFFSRTDRLNGGIPKRLMLILWRHKLQDIIRAPSLIIRLCTRQWRKSGGGVLQDRVSILAMKAGTEQVYNFLQSVGKGECALNIFSLLVEMSLRVSL